MWAYRATVFGAAFLMFQIQPMTAKALLPGFGGSYLVWGAGMVFYQGLLLLGYVYAHFVQRRFGVARYARLHWILLLAAAACLPLRFDRPSPPPGLPLAAGVFVHLLLTVGLPFLTLSTTSLLLQRRLSVSDLPERENPYVLYGASNLGSMLALVTYPTVFEPLLGLEQQRAAWWAGYAAVVALHAFCRGGAFPGSAPPERCGNLPFRLPLGWFLLSGGACALLVATTNVITLDVAAVPLLWVLPLILYLSAFVLTFSARPWCPPWARGFLPWAVILGIHLQLMLQFRLALPAWLPIAAYLLVLFFVCLNCCDRLIRRKPDDPRHLTSFYVAIALGGFCGSALVSWVVPVFSRSLAEYPLAFAIVAAALAVIRDRNRGNCDRTRRKWIETAVCVTIVGVAMGVIPPLAGRFTGGGESALRPLALVVTVPVALALRLAAGRPWQFAVTLAVVLLLLGRVEERAAGAASVLRFRNYYGIYKVLEKDNMRYLKHGTTLHGRQYVAGPAVKTPLAYHHPTTPVGEIMTSPRFAFKRVAMIGLGAGALATYIDAGRSLTIYELDPDNLAVAESYFTYLSLARGRGVKPRFVWGDGRVSLRRETSSSFDLLVIDAFSSGSIPVHLVTVEAFREYFRALDPDGLILLNVSRKVLDVVPVVYGTVQTAGGFACEKSNVGRCHPDADETRWMAISADRALIQALVRDMQWQPGIGKKARPWTDRYSNIFGALF